MNRARPSRFPTARTSLLVVLAFALASSAAPSALRVSGLSVARAGEAPTTNMTTVGGAVSSKETALTRIQRMVARLNKESSTPEGEELVVARLAGQFRVSPDTLRAQHAAWGLGYGEVAMAYGFARASRKPGVTAEDVVEMRRGGAAWPSIASNLGVKIDTVASRMRRQTGPRGTTKAK
jgi:hypothetical protein